MQWDGGFPHPILFFPEQGGKNQAEPLTSFPCPSIIEPCAKKECVGMNWAEVRVKTTPEGIEILTGFLMAHGVNGVMIEDAGDFNRFLRCV